LSGSCGKELVAIDKKKVCEKQFAFIKRIKIKYFDKLLF